MTQWVYASVYLLCFKHITMTQTIKNTYKIKKKSKEEKSKWKEETKKYVVAIKQHKQK